MQKEGLEVVPDNAPADGTTVTDGRGADADGAPQPVAVTGAGGKTGRAVVAALARRGVATAALVHRTAQVDAVRRAGATRVVVGDQRIVDDVQHVVTGVEVVYAIAPNLHPDEVMMGETLVAACHRAGVARIVFHSVIHPQLTRMPHHRDKARVEELLVASRLPTTILRPNAYHDNVLGHLDLIAATGEWAVPYDPDTPLASIALSDVAEVAATVIAEPGHDHAAHDLSGPQLLTPADAADVLGEVLGRPVRAVRRDVEEVVAAAPPRSRGRLRAMFACYDDMGSPGNPAAATWLLGRPPRSFRRWLPEVIG